MIPVAYALGLLVERRTQKGLKPQMNTDTHKSETSQAELVIRVYPCASVVNSRLFLNTTDSTFENWNKGSGPLLA
jgi:hypothetical protein